MGIEKAIEIISDIDKAYRMFTSEEIQALEVSLHTMHKYQKIEEIMNADLEHIHRLDRDKYIVASIKEVINNVD